MEEFTYNCHNCYTVTFTNHPISRCPDCLQWEEQPELGDPYMCLTLRLLASGKTMEQDIAEWRASRV